MSQSANAAIDRKPSRLRGIAPRLLLALGSAVVTLLAIEAFMRATGFGCVLRMDQSGRIVKPSPVPGMGYENDPGTERTWMRETAAGPIWSSARINRYGFRGPEHPPGRPPGTLRIACIGDSFTFGSGVNDDETWPAALERALATRQDLPVQVWNCGVEGYDTWQERVHLEARVLHFAPDVVVLGYYLNDVTAGQIPQVDDGRWVTKLAERIASTDAKAHPVPAFLRRHSRLYDALADRLLATLSKIASYNVYTAAYVEDSEGWQRVRRGLIEMRDLLAKRNVGFVVVLFPLLHVDGLRMSHDAYQMVARFCAENAIACIDLEPEFIDRDPEALILHPNNRHPNPAGHTIAADAIATALIERGLLD